MNEDLHGVGGRLQDGRRQREMAAASEAPAATAGTLRP